MPERRSLTELQAHYGYRQGGRRTMHGLSARRGRAALIAVLAAASIAVTGLGPSGGQGEAAAQTGQPELMVYTYSSFVSWGPAKQIEEAFESSHDVDVVFVAPGDTGEVYGRLVGERESGGSEADVFIGLPDDRIPDALSRDLFLPLELSALSNLNGVPERLLVDETGHLVPYDHGYVTLVYDSQRLDPSDAPRTFEELTDPKYRGKIIGIDPRSSAPGTSFLLWTIHEYGTDGFLDYWRELLPNLLTITGGWSEAYAMFENGEAPIVVSYSTDTAYSYIYGGSTRYQVITLGGEGYEQVEMMGIVRGTDQRELASQFINYVLSPEVQALIPTTNWMFPANERAEPPADFVEYAVVPEHPVRLPADMVSEHKDEWLRAWAELVIQ